jgi:intracellular sulfur oxidation DsrE/DsrF family protein
MANSRILIIVIGLLAATAGVAYYLKTEPTVTYPRIAGYGDMVSLPEAAQQPRKGAKVLFDLTADAKPGDVNKGLVRTARLLNLYAAAGLPDHDVKVTVVLHGEATKAVLSDKAYAARFDAKDNPNLPLIRELKKAGVEVFVCGQSLNSKKYQAEEVAPEVTVAVSALTVLINKQAEGYVLVP